MPSPPRHRTDADLDPQAALRTFGVASSSKSIVALGGLYFLVAYPLSGGGSIYGQTLGPAAKYTNKGPLLTVFCNDEES